LQRLAAQEFSFSGYVVDIPMYSIPYGDAYENTLVNLTRLRLRPNLQLWDGATLALEHESVVLLSSASYFFAMESPDITNRQAVDLRWHPVREKHAYAQHFVDRLYLRQNLSWGSFVLGRQRIQWGTGRIWNPTDLFNPINPASIDKIEKDGADAFSAKLHLGHLTDLHFIYNFRPTFDSSNIAARFRTNISEYDLSAMSGLVDKRLVFGGDMAGNLYDAGVRAEALWVGESEDGRRDSYLRWIFGADYQLTSRLYLMLEYLYNGEGINDPKRYDYSRLFRGEILNLNRKYLYLGAMYQLHPLVLTTVGFNANTNDGSGFVLANAVYSSSDNSMLSAGLLLPFGSQTDEYRIYPTMFYAKAEFHF